MLPNLAWQLNDPNITFAGAVAIGIELLSLSSKRTTRLDAMAHIEEIHTIIFIRLQLYLTASSTGLMGGK